MEENIFNEAMIRQFKLVVEEDHAGAVMMGSTAMALADEVAAAVLVCLCSFQACLPLK